MARPFLKKIKFYYCESIKGMLIYTIRKVKLKQTNIKKGGKTMANEKLTLEIITEGTDPDATTQGLGCCLCAFMYFYFW